MLFQTQSHSRKLPRLLSLLLFLAATWQASAGPGGVDPSFNPRASSYVYSVVPQADGTVFIAGLLYQVGNVRVNGVAHLYADGSLDTNYVAPTGQYSSVNAMLQQPDGKLLIGGNFSIASNSQTNVARLNPDGTLDTTFTNSNPSGIVYALGLQTDGKVLLGGGFSTVGGSNHVFVARLNSDGSVDSTFTTPTFTGNWVNSLAVQNDGSIVIGGGFNYVTNSHLYTGVARLTTNGILDTNYQPNLTSSVNALYLQKDGRVLWAGGSGLGRLNTNGSTDTTFPSTAVNTYYSVYEDSNNCIYAGGPFNYFSNNVPRLGLVRLYPDGTLDKTFYTNMISSGENHIFSIAMQNDGKLLIGGQIDMLGGYTNYELARLYGSTCPAEIANQPRSTNAAVGTTVTFSVFASNPTPLSYQWYLNGTPIPGATYNEYSVFNVQTQNAGVYSVIVTNDLGTAISSNALLQVGIPPTITQPPADQAVTVGQPAAFAATATGSTPLHFQWLTNATYISGATNTNYVIASAALTDAGAYRLAVTNLFGGVTNFMGNLSVGIPPQNLLVSLNTSGQPVIQMPGTSGFNYQLQVTTNLTPPVIWQTIATNAADTNGNWTYTDTNGPTWGALYYRVMAN